MEEKFGRQCKDGGNKTKQNWKNREVETVALCMVSNLQPIPIWIWWSYQER